MACFSELQHTVNFMKCNLKLIAKEFIHVMYFDLVHILLITMKNIYISFAHHCELLVKGAQLCKDAGL